MEVNEMDKNTAYKQSTVGRIPSDWEVDKLKGKALIKGGYAFDSSKFQKTGHYQVVKMSNLYDNNLDLSRSESFITELEQQEKEYVLKRGDILITLTGTVGKRDYGFSFQIADEGNLVLNQRVAKIEPIDIDAKYLYYEVKTDRFLNQFFYSSRGGTGNQANVGTNDLSDISILCPPLPEQRRIAACLSSWDEAITKTTQLIAQKEQQKKWLMQQLLTGKKRLRGFSGEWKDIPLKQCFQFIKSYSISREGLSKDLGNQYCIHYGDIHALYETEFLDFKMQNSIPRIVDSRIIIHEKDYLKEGDIIMADASEDYKGVGEIVIVLNLDNKIAVGGLHTIVLRDFAGLTDPIFRGYLFSSEKVRNELRVKATGASVYSVTKPTLESLMLYLPKREEQLAIGLVLQAADKEIQLLKAKADKLKEEKKWLMQVLLTGKKRLKIENN